MSHTMSHHVLRAETVCYFITGHGARKRLSKGQEGMAQEHQYTSGNNGDSVGSPGDLCFT